MWSSFRRSREVKYFMMLISNNCSFVAEEGKSKARCSVTFPEHVSWVLLQAHSHFVAWEEKRIQFDERSWGIWSNAREYVLRQLWQSFVDDKFDLENAIQTEAEFSYAVGVMDKIVGWEEVNRVESRFAASMWMYTKAVICNGQNHMQNYKLLKFRFIRETVNGVCDNALDEHLWVSELPISCQEAKVLEALQYELVNPCTVQWRMLWFSATTSLKHGFFDDGVIFEKDNEAVNLAMLASFTLPF